LKKTKYIVTLLLAFLAITTQAQQIPGLQSSNYGGLYRATYNPSVLGGAKQKWQINIGTLGGSINYRYFVFLGKNSLFYPLLSSHSTKELYGRSRTMGSLTEDPLHLVSEIRWPSAMYSIDERQGIAIQFRSRGYVTGNNLPDPIRNMYFRRLDTGETPPMSAQSWGKFNLVQQNFSEVSFTYGIQLLDLDAHKFRVGFTGKRVFAARIGYINAAAEQFSILPEAANNEMSELHLSNLTYESGYSRPTERLKLGGLFDADVSGTGWGYDLGVTYELGKFWKNTAEQFDQNPQYILRLGASLTDVGNIRYKTGHSRVTSGFQERYTMNQTALETVGDRGPQGFMDLLPAQNDSTFSATVRLPQALHLEADIQLVKGFFLNLSQTKRYKSRNSEILDIYQPNVFTVTPRFEDEDSDFAFPISFIEGNKRPSIGAVAHFGPVFLGFSNINGLIKKTGARGSMVYLGFTAWKLNRDKKTR
jgi:hypothetical protein